MKRGDLYEGPKSIFHPEDVNGPHGFYAMTEDGRELLLYKGKPVRLVHVDLAPGNAEDGREEFRVAGPTDPPSVQGRLVDLEMHAEAGAEVGL